MTSRKETRRMTVAIERLAESPSPRPTDRVYDQPSNPIGLMLRRKFYVKEEATARAVEARRAFPIMAYVGPNGGGKSLAMVHDSLPSLDAGRKVISTVALLDENGAPHPNCERFEHWDQLLDARDCDILMDEMVGIAGSRESAKLDVRVQNVLVQLRRRNIVLRWSAPNWARADKIVREVTQSVTECRGYFADKRVVRTDGAENATQLWAPKRLFTFSTYDTIDFEEWSAGKRDDLKPTVKEWFYGPESRAFKSYNTLDAVTMVAGTDDGMCTACGKKARVEYCKGHSEQMLEHLIGAA